MKKLMIAFMLVMMTSLTFAQEKMIGEVRMFAGTFAPRGWFLCQGQLLSINQYTTLFSVIGTTYGGDGRTTFALPDLRGRTPMGVGKGPGLTPTNLGENKGREYLYPKPVKIPMSDAGTDFYVFRFPQALIQPPTLTINYIICFEGYYPSRP